MRVVKTSQKDGLTRRSMLLAGVSMAAFATLTARLGYLQIFKKNEYQTMAEENRIKLVLTPPPRGQLLDRNGRILAGRRQHHRLLFEPQIDGQVEPLEVLEKLKKLVPISTQRLKEAEHQLKRRGSAPILLKDYLTWEELSALEFQTPNLPGAMIDMGEMRDYPLGQMLAHLVGYVSTVAKNDNPDSPLLKLPGFKIGKNGIEKSMEEVLQGQAGIRSVEVNVHGSHLREVSRKPSVAGKDVTLTLDERLQRFIVERLGDESGAVIVMDVHNGEILAFASNPAFDPNKFSEGISANYWKELQENERNPLLNKAITGQYPPGSTFKMMTGLAGLEAGVINTQTRFFCPGHYYMGSHRFNCWKEEGHGSVNLEEALAKSCDTYFYNVGQRLGIEKLAEVGKEFGLGAPTGLNVPGEKGGAMPNSAWKMKRFKQPWQGGDTINVAIGQGYVLTTPLQLAVMVARLVNGGYAVTPQLTLQNDAPDYKPIPVKQEHLVAIKLGMDAVMNKPMGTAYAQRIQELGMEMGGKTGTAQVRRILQRGQDQNTLPWHLRHHALFVGYAPVDKPRFAISVVIEHGGGGASAAAPVARDVLRKVQELYPNIRGIQLLGDSV